MSFVIEGIKGQWELVVGLEIHAQITAKSKLFSSASTEFGNAPNSNVSFFDVGYPGTLPVLNMQCIHQAVKTGLGLNAAVNKYSVFDRKNYFYPDLPNGYQITQYHYPIVQNGVVRIDMDANTTKDIRVNRIHIEQDAGKSLHDQSPTKTFVDFNRAGCALMEIVTEPDIRSLHEVGEFLKKLRSILRYLGTCDGDMEKGSMRCDANVSVRPLGSTTFGTRAEIKNVNSIKNAMKAVEYEAERQVQILESGGQVAQETRLFDANTGQTRSMRSKEEAQDYRYFPDPDLLPLTLDDDYIAKIKADLPELPDQKIERYVKSFGLTHYDASVLVSEKTTALYFEEVASKADPKAAAKWITVELFSHLNKMGQSLESTELKPKLLADLICMMSDNIISGKIAKHVLERMLQTGKSAAQIVEEENLVQVTDTSEIDGVIEKILQANPDKVSEYRSGKDKLFGFFVGQVMKETGGKANPQAVNDLLKAKLS